MSDPLLRNLVQFLHNVFIYLTFTPDREGTVSLQSWRPNTGPETPQTPREIWHRGVEGKAQMMPREARLKNITWAEVIGEECAPVKVRGSNPPMPITDNSTSKCPKKKHKIHPRIESSTRRANISRKTNK